MGPSCGGEDEASQPLSFQKVKRVLAISELAAKNGMQDLSLRGVREALQHGTPWVSAPTDIPPDAADDPQPFVVNQIQSELASLMELWTQQKFDDVAVWDTLRSIVLREDHTDGLQVYQRLNSNNTLSMDLIHQSAGSLLIRHSIAMGRTKELRSLLETRLTHSATQLDASMLLLMLALESGDSDDVLLRLKAFPTPMIASSESRHALPLAILSLRTWFSGEQHKAVIPVMEQAVQNILAAPASENANSCAASMVMLMARDHFLKGRRDAGIRILKLTEPLLTQRTAALSESAFAQLQVDRQVDAASLLLQFGFVDEAMTRLETASRIEAAAKTERSSASLKTASPGRSLWRLPAAKRYEILRDSTILSPEAQLLKTSVEFLSRDVPPNAFLRLLPEGIRDTGFDSPGDGITGILLSSATLLSEAAQECGQLETLRAELQKTVNDDSRKAWYLLLVHLQNGELAQAKPMLEQLLVSLDDDLRQNRRGRDSVFDLIVALQAAEHAELRPLAIRILESGRRFELSATKSRTFVHFSDALAAAHAADAGSDLKALLRKAAPALWTSGGNFGSAALQNGNPEAKWIAHEGMIAHLTGRENDSLYFPWPLGGTFEFSVTSLDAEALNGDLGFAGLMCESITNAGTTTVSGLGNYNPVGRALRLAQDGTWVRKSVRVTPELLTFLVNGHPVYSETRSPDSNPWLHLSGRATRAGFWRLPEFTGTPQIPREVALSDDPLLRGWNCNLFNQSRSDAITRDAPGATSSNSTASLKTIFDWSWDKGVITGRHVPDARRISATLDENVQGLLLYERPLMSGETLSWDFDYLAGQTEVHPALGRLAFLFRPDGVRLHWMSIGAHAWTTLPADNEVMIPEDRRGSAMLTLKDGWNTASLNLNGDLVTLAVNGDAVYEHTLRSHDSRQFGLFHFRDQTTASARNLKLTGDWPERINEDVLQQLTASVSANCSTKEHEALNRMIGPMAFATDPVDVIRYAQGLPVEQRFGFLLAWVLPGNNHREWRLFSDLSESDAVSSAADAFSSDPISREKLSVQPPIHSTGGYLISPALELIRVAGDTGRAEELRTLAETTADLSAAGQRHKLTFLILLAVEAARLDDAKTLIGQMRQLTEARTSFEMEDAWPELLVAQQCLPVRQLRPDAVAMLRQIATTQTATDSNSKNSALQVQARVLHSALATATMLDATDNGAAASQPKDWHSFRMMRADLRNDGVPAPLWVQHANGSIQHVSGFEDDVLCWPQPMQGEFTFECELVPVNGEYLQIGYGGHFLKLAVNWEETRMIPYGRDPVPHTTPLAAVDAAEIWSYRLVVAQQKAEVRINGKRMSSADLSENADPWLYVRSAGIAGAMMRNAKISGSPEVPENVGIDTNRDLEGWCRPYFGGVEPFVPRNRSGSDWRSDESLIVGLQRTALAGTKSESLLQYFRPLLEDGTMSYSFLYDPGVALVHPALGRTAFVLGKDRGVLTHDITNGMYERSGIDPANVTAEPQHQLVQTLPLRVKDWNAMQLRLEDNTVTLILNDTEIFRRPVESTNDRTFGLFYYLDESSARVRDVSWQGNWRSTP